MSNPSLPAPVTGYLEAKQGTDANAALAWFAEDATVWDNGEELELKGTEQIREWLSGTVAVYELTSEVVSGEHRGDEFVAGVVVSGKFPGSPYKFENRFKLRGDRIVELTIDPIGSLAE